MFRYDFKNLHFSHKINKITLPNDMFDKHIHPFHEIYYLVKGNVTLNIESKAKVLKEGDLIIIPAGTYHYAAVETGADYERYIINFEDVHSFKFLTDKIKNQSEVCINMKHLSYIFESFDNYYTELTNEEFYVYTIAEINKLLITAFKGEQQHLSEKDEIFSKIVNYIDEHIEENFTINSICDEFHYSKSFITELFKKHMHCPLMKYIKQKKITYAHKLILAGEKKGEVAKRIGFNDYSTFYRQYHTIIGSQISKK